MPLYENRKISVSFISHQGESSTYFDPIQGQLDNPALKTHLQKILRLQVFQIVLGLTLIILSTVAIIDQRIFFSLGFAIIPALLCIFCSVLGIHEGFGVKRLEIGAIFLALLSLLPGFILATSALYENFNSSQISREISLPSIIHSNSQIQSGKIPQEEDEAISPHPSATVCIVGTLEIIHLFLLSSSLIYTLYLHKSLHAYISSSSPAPSLPSQ